MKACPASGHGLTSRCSLRRSGSFPAPCPAWPCAGEPPAPRDQSAASPLFMTAILSSAFVLNLALPGPVGEAISAGMLSQRSKPHFQILWPHLPSAASLGWHPPACSQGSCGPLPFPTPPEWASILSATAVVLLLVAGGTAAVTLFPATPIRILNAFKPSEPKNGLSRLWLKTIDAILLCLRRFKQQPPEGLGPMPTRSFGLCPDMRWSPAASPWRHKPVAPQPHGRRLSSPMRPPLPALWSCSCSQAQRLAGMSCLAPPWP